MLRCSGQLVLLADSQLFFSQKNTDWFMDRMRQASSGASSFAAYIGAANGNEPAFYDMAKGAFARFGITDSVFLQQGLEDLAAHRNKVPSVILLSGGDVQLGWRYISRPEIRNWLIDCYHQGSLLVGISAGAIHLTNVVDLDSTITPLLNLLPVVPLAHEENEDWPGEARYLASLKAHESSEPRYCLKLPMGSGVWVNSNGLVTFGKTPAQLQRQHTQIELSYHKD